MHDIRYFCFHQSKVTEDRASVTVACNVLLWSGGNEFEPCQVELGGKWHFCPKVTDGQVVRTGLSVTWNVLSYDLEVMSLTSGRIELEMLGFSVISCTWTKNRIYFAHYVTELLFVDQQNLFHKGVERLSASDFALVVTCPSCFPSTEQQF